MPCDQGGGLNDEDGRRAWKQHEYPSPDIMSLLTWKQHKYPSPWVSMQDKGGRRGRGNVGRGRGGI